MQKVEVPKYPSTPKHSPVHDEQQRKKLRESVYEGDEALSGKPEIPKIEKQTSSQVLYEQWQKFLNKDEEIEMGSTVEKSKYFGMGSEKSVMLLTSMRRILIIDPTKMELRKGGDIPRSSIVSCHVIDKETFQLNFVKNKAKYKCSGPKADKWKKAFDKVC